ncbi:MAG TPA: helix-turn-helix transcriptional regulator [Lamprocystis sp. (in: g-proteobacteria)]|nr:helix-turn-helix transcriptional regulator [Lamprocystis sp. (in: g-proteobacteria)]
MSTVQIIERDGQPEWAVIPYADYARMEELLADIKDTDDILAFRADLAAGREELVPVEVVDRLLAGEAPVRVWRRHRGLTQQALAAAAGLSKSYLSQIESGKKTGTLETLGRLARVLGLEVDDLAPAGRA